VTEQGRIPQRGQFDDALVFSGSDRREVVQGIERLPAGESKDMALSLTSDKTGSHCCWFMVTREEAGSDVEMVSRQVCVEFVTRHVEIDVVGPTQRTEGSRAEFNITLANNSLKNINDTQVVVAYDKALMPREASAEAEKKSGTLVWNLGVLRPMEKVQLQVEFECQRQAHRACVFVDVKGANLNGEREEACLEIVPVPGTLDLRVGDRDDPLETGRNGVYEATVQNIGLQPARGIPAVLGPLVERIYHPAQAPGVVICECGDLAGLVQLHQARGEHLRVHAVVTAIAIREESDHRRRDPPDPGLERGAVGDERRDVGGDRTIDVARFHLGKHERLAVGLDEYVDLVDVHAMGECRQQATGRRKVGVGFHDE
jgi:hypothetical protein